MKQKIRLLSSIAVLSILLISCGQKKRELTAQDKTIISTAGYDEALLKELRMLTDSSFSITTGSPALDYSFEDSVTYDRFAAKKLTGLTLNESQDNVSMLVEKLGDKFRQRGYFMYISDVNFGYAPDKITILKTDDKFDLLRFEGTSGVNYDIFVEEIIRRLDAWDQSYGLELRAVGGDFIAADFTTLPENLDAYANELYEFCPDIVDQGTGSVEELAEEIKSTKKLFLWWD